MATDGFKFCSWLKALKLLISIDDDVLFLNAMSKCVIFKLLKNLTLVFAFVLIVQELH